MTIYFKIWARDPIKLFVFRHFDLVSHSVGGMQTFKYLYKYYIKFILYMHFNEIRVNKIENIKNKNKWLIWLGLIKVLYWIV